MATNNVTAAPTSGDSAHAYMLMPGIQVNIDSGQAQDYADMRAAQLSALMNVMALAEDCEHSTMGEQVRSNIQWLASTLAGEVHQLIEIVADDAEIMANSRNIGTK